MPSSSNELKKYFTRIYQGSGWRKVESASGAGSTVQNTKHLLGLMVDLFEELKIKRIVDVPCGDFNWMRNFPLKKDMHYTGGDIVDELIESNIKKYKKRNVDFKVIDITKDSLPDSDIVIVRDCFVHLSLDAAYKAFANLKKQNFKYILVTSFTEHPANRELNGLWRELNLQLPPFNLPPPLKVLNENYRNSDKSMCLWSKQAFQSGDTVSENTSDMIRGQVILGGGHISRISEDIFQSRCKAARAKLVKGSLNVSVENMQQALDYLGQPDFETDQSDHTDNPLRWWRVELTADSARDVPSGKTFVVRHARTGPDGHLDVLSEVHFRTALNLKDGSTVQLSKTEYEKPIGVVATMCMWHPRWPGSLKTVRSLEGQVDTLYLCLNDFWKVPEELKQDWIEILHLGHNLGDAARFYLLRNLGPLDAHVISCDDDIEYPKSYVQDFLAAHEQHPEALLTYGGETLCRNRNNQIYYEISMVVFKDGPETLRLDSPGSGCSFIPKSLFNQMEFTSLVHFKQSDTHLSCNCRKLGAPIIGLQHTADYVRYTPPPGLAIHRTITRKPDRMHKVGDIYRSYGLSLEDAVPKLESKPTPPADSSPSRPCLPEVANAAPKVENMIEGKVISGSRGISRIAEELFQSRCKAAKAKLVKGSLNIKVEDMRQVLNYLGEPDFETNQMDRVNNPLRWWRVELTTGPACDVPPGKTFVIRHTRSGAPADFLDVVSEVHFRTDLNLKDNSTVQLRKPKYEQPIGVAATMCMWHPRWPGSMKTVRSLEGQVDTLYLCLNDFWEVPEELKQDWIEILHFSHNLGDGARLYLLRNTKFVDAHVISCDDDIDYPETYVQDFLAAHAENPDALLSHLGSVILPDDNYAFRHCQTVFHDKHEAKSVHVEAPGAGVSFIPKSLFNKMEFTSSVYFNQADVHLACNCRKLAIPIITVPHPGNYFKSTGVPGPSIHKTITRKPDRTKKVHEIYASYGLTLEPVSDQPRHPDGCADIEAEIEDIIRGKVISGSRGISRISEELFQSRCKAARANLVKGSLNVKVEDMRQVLNYLGEPDFETNQMDQMNNPLRWWQVELTTEPACDVPPGKTFVIRHAHSAAPDDYLDVVSEVYFRTDLNLKDNSTVQLRKTECEKPIGVAATMCMWHPRWPGSMKTVRSLEGQVDTLYLCLNDFWEVPKELKQDWIEILHFGENLGDAARFYLLRNIDSMDAHIISCDDDFEYPNTHVSDFLTAHEQYPDALLCYQGEIAYRADNGEINLQNRIIDEKPEIMRLSMPGSGSSFIPKSIFNRLEFSNLVHFNQADIHLGANCFKLGVPVIRLPRYAETTYKYTEPPGPRLGNTVNKRPDRIQRVHEIYASYGLKLEPTPALEPESKRTRLPETDTAQGKNDDETDSGESNPQSPPLPINAWAWLRPNLRNPRLYLLANNQHAGDKVRALCKILKPNDCVVHFNRAFWAGEFQDHPNNVLVLRYPGSINPGGEKFHNQGAIHNPQFKAVYFIVPVHPDSPYREPPALKACQLPKALVRYAPGTLFANIGIGSQASPSTGFITWFMNQMLDPILVGFTSLKELDGTSPVDHSSGHEEVYLNAHAARYLGADGSLMHNRPSHLPEQAQTLMRTAVREGRMDLLDNLLQSPEVDINQPDASGQTALVEAVIRSDQHFEMFEHLLGVEGIDILQPGFNRFDPLGMAIHRGAVKVIKRLLADPRMIEGRRSVLPQDFLALVSAPREMHIKKRVGCLNRLLGDPELAELLAPARDAEERNALLLTVERPFRPDIYKPDEHGGYEQFIRDTGFAPAEYRPALLETLLAYPVIDATAVDKHGNNALHLAAANGHVRCVELLLEDGRADPQARNADGLTPLDCAKQAKHKAIIEKLKAHNPADAPPPSADDSPPESLETLFTQGPAPPKPSEAQSQAWQQEFLEWVSGEKGGSFEKRRDTLHLLHKKRKWAKLLAPARDNENRTALMRVIEHKGSGLYRPDILRVLLSLPEIDLTATDNHGNNALHLAAAQGNARAVTYLLGDGRFDLQARNDAGQTPLECAEQGGHPVIVAQLKARAENLALPRVKPSQPDLETDKLTFVTVLTSSGGEYLPEHVERLRQGIAEHCSVPHRFFCLSDQPLHCPWIPLTEDWEGWWSKLEIFKHNFGPTVYFDLDTLIVDNLDWMVDAPKQFSMIKDFRETYLNSGVMAWTGDEYRHIADKFKPKKVPYYHARWPGDGGWIREHAPEGASLQERFPDKIISWKISGWNAPGASVVCFYGTPRPWEVEPPVKKNEMFQMPIMEGSRYTTRHVAFYKMWQKEAGYQYIESTEFLGNSLFYFKWNGLKGVIDFIDFAEPRNRDSSVAHDDSSIPVFKAHYSRDVEYPEHYFPLAPMMCTDAPQSEDVHHLAIQSFEFRPQSGFTCKQRVFGNATRRRNKVHALLKEHFPDIDLKHNDSPVKFWNAHKTKLAAICVPGATNNMLDRGQMELMMLGVCTISPYLPEVLLGDIRPEPNVDYLKCADDYSDLIDICKSLTPERSKQIGNNARAKMAALQPKPFWDYVIRTLQNWYAEPKPASKAASAKTLNTITLARWCGRLNNNIIQLLNCIDVARTDQYHEVRFPTHTSLSDNKIIISQDQYPEKQPQRGDFFDTFRNNPRDFKQRKKDFIKYIKPILQLAINPKLQEDVVVYIRGGDALAHGGITQPPLYFYQQMLAEYRKQKKSVRLICQDMSNPCAKWLVDNKWVIWEQQSLEDDISYMANAKVLCMAYGTFTYLPILLSTALEELWIPDYIIHDFRRAYTDHRDLCEGGVVRPVYLGEPFLHIMQDHPKNWKQVLLEYEPKTIDMIQGLVSSGSGGVLRIPEALHKARCKAAGTELAKGSLSVRVDNLEQALDYLGPPHFTTAQADQPGNDLRWWRVELTTEPEREIPSGKTFVVRHEHNGPADYLDVLSEVHFRKKMNLADNTPVRLRKIIQGKLISGRGGVSRIPDDVYQARCKAAKAELVKGSLNVRVDNLNQALDYLGIPDFTTAQKNPPGDDLRWWQVELTTDPAREIPPGKTFVVRHIRTGPGDYLDVLSEVHFRSEANLDDNSTVLLSRLQKEKSGSSHTDSHPVSETIYLAWYRERGKLAKNWGDALNPELAKLISGGCRVVYVNPADTSDQFRYYAAGSILSFARGSANSEIWGTGLIQEVNTIKIKPKKVHAVRGPLTRKILLANNIECPEIYGDPALLFPRFYDKSVKRKYQVGIIPHYVDQNNPWVRLQFEKKWVKVIDIFSETYDFIDQVRSCELIISSSLHGLIAADAYGIPAIWVELSNKVFGNGFKFRDYYGSIGINNITPVKIINGKTSLDDIINNFEEYEVNIDLDALHEACPFKARTLQDWYDKPETVDTKATVANLIEGKVMSGSGKLSRIPDKLFQARCKAAEAELVKGSLNVQVDDINRALDDLGAPDFTTAQADAPGNDLRWWRVELSTDLAREMPPGKTFVVRHTHTGPADYLDVLSEVHFRSKAGLDDGAIVRLRRLK